MKFDAVTIKNFRNFENITIDLTNKNVLFGMNDVGKTNFLYALRFLFDKDVRRQNFIDTDYYKKNTNTPIEILVSIDIGDTEDGDSQKLRAKLKGAILSGQDKVYIKVNATYDEKELVGIPVLYWGGDVEDLEEMKVHGTFFDIDYVFNVFYIDAYVDLYTLFKKNANTLLVNDKEQDKEILENIQKACDDLNTQISGLSGIKAFSVRNLKYMAKFAEIYPDREFVQQVVAQIPWGHNIVLLDKVADMDERKWYIKKSAENGWSRNVLVHQIESNLYQRQVLADKVTNFDHRLPSPQSELAVQTMKDPYVFDFIPFREDMLERDIEQALVRDVTKLLLELGTGFAFLGNQYHLNVGGDDFYIDLLFYNLNLRCYVVIELKTGDFKPEYAGQLNFYLSAVDGILKKEQDNPSIGLLLCKSKNNVVAEYSLKDISKPIGVSEYKITSSLPDALEKQLPSVEDIQKRIK